ncbi:MAG: hypothetical protein IJ511_01440 [Bacteroides sp.]|nr:hypothetical protein [Bacteroides sp.]
MKHTARLLATALLLGTTPIIYIGQGYAQTVEAGAVFNYQGHSLQADEHHLYVSPQKDATFGRKCPYVFNDLRQALLEAERLQTLHPYSEEQPLSIYIAPSVYWLDNPDTPEVRLPLPGEGIPYGMRLRLSHLRLIGLSDDPTHTILASNRGQTQGAVGNFTMIHFTGDDIQAENLTFGNYCNVDLVYPLNPSLNRKRRADAIVQAQLIICDGDRYVARNCHFISRLNLCPFAGARRVLFDRCYFECTDDALCGTGVYLSCRFTLFSGKPFYATHHTGAVFLNCDLHTLTESIQYLVKVGSPVSMVDCRWSSRVHTLPIHWTQDPTADQRSYQYNLTLNGKPLTIGQRPHLTVDMAGKPLLRAYKRSDGGYNLYNLLRGEDNWDPTGQRTYTHPEEASLPTQLQLSHYKARIESGKDTLHLKAAASRMGTRPDFNTPTNVTWEVAAADLAYVELHPQADGSCIVTGRNQSLEEHTVNIMAHSNEGLERACVTTILPLQLPSPDFTRKPRLKPCGNRMEVRYRLSYRQREDCSTITWYRCKDADGRKPVIVATNQLDTPLKSYQLTADDNGYYLMARIVPKQKGTLAGEAISVITPRPVSLKEQSVKRITTDFTDFPTERQHIVKEGFWTLDAYKPADTKEFEWEADTSRSSWHYGYGMDGAKHVQGLQQSVKGARLRYTPLSGKYADMSITLLLDPCKTAGQGFGSATGQYLDICIKMDTRHLTGYGLRIVRTTKNDKAVDFLLIKYENGIVTPISEAVSSICYRSGCMVKVKACGKRLTAEAYNRNALPEVHHPHLTTQVFLEAEIDSGTEGGILIQHTGSTGANATLLRQMEIEYAP